RPPLAAGGGRRRAFGGRGVGVALAGARPPPAGGGALGHRHLPDPRRGPALARLRPAPARLASLQERDHAEPLRLGRPGALRRAPGPRRLPPALRRAPEAPGPGGRGLGDRRRDERRADVRRAGRAGGALAAEPRRASSLIGSEPWTPRTLSLQKEPIHGPRPLPPVLRRRDPRRG